MPAKKKTEPKSAFIKFTRLDGTPIWINSSFVVTVEPRRGGGATVVPIGDGLDYDVRETPEVVLALLSGAEVPAVVPVPAPPGLAPKPAYAKPEPDETVTQNAKVPSSPAAAAPRTVSKTVTRQAVPSVSTGDGATTPAVEVAPAQTASNASSGDAVAAPVDVNEQPVEPPPGSRLSYEEVERLRKMAPGTIRKLHNTLVKQFKVSDPESVIMALKLDNVISVTAAHVVWRSL